MKVFKVLDEYTRELVARKTSTKNLQRHHSAVRILTRHIGDLEHYELTKKNIRDYIRNRDVKPQTASRELDVLSSALNFCNNERIIDWSIFKFEKYKSPARATFLSRKDIDALLSECHEYHLRVWMLIALSTAARSGAILGLKCDKVNFVDSIIDFRDESIEGKHKPRSVIKMPEALRPYLEDAVSKSVSGYVVEKDGKPVKSIYYDCIRAAQRAGLKNVSPHTMRHTCAVHMVKNDVPIYEVSKYLGHKSIEITQKHYAKFSPDFMKKSSNVGSMLIQGQPI